MIQRCPKCGAWCSAEEINIGDRAVSGFKKVGEIGSKVGKLANIGKLGKKLGKYAGLYYFGIANAAYGALFGDKYHFECPRCGNEWGVDDDSKDEKRELLDEVNGLLQNVNDADTTIGNRESYVDSLETELDRVSSLADGKFKDVLTAGLDYVSGNVRAPLDYYESLKYLANYKGIGGACQLFEKKILQEYSNVFLQIPYTKRRFLVVVSELDSKCFPDSLMAVPHDFVPSGLMFPEGHPMDYALYICHPYRPNYYLPFDAYQAELLEDELDEYKKLLQALGAKTIEVEKVRKNSVKTVHQEEISGTVGVKKQGVDLNVEGDTSIMEQKNEDFLEKDKLKMASDKIKAPYVPEGLVWYSHRPKWKSLVENRLERGMRVFEERISTRQEVSCLKDGLQQLSVDFEALVASGDVSGKRKIKKTFNFVEGYELNVKVEFYPLQSYNKKWFDWIWPEKK